MPYLIDGNNLMYAVKAVWKDIGRVGLCQLLGAYIDATDETVCLVLDGCPPPHGVAQQMAHPRLEILYGCDQTADEVLKAHILHHSSPRRLTVVSTDHEIRQAARHRRCEWLASEEFAPELVRVYEAGRKPAAPPAEPAEKQSGLTPEQTAQWLRELGVEDE